ncbi:MAG: hypothetical protein OHK0031_02590 [Anaerolineales bacterium]
MSIKIQIICLLTAAMLMTSCAPAAPSRPAPTEIPPTITAAPPTLTPPPTERSAAPIEPGTYMVTDLVPGIYRGQSQGELPRGICYWARLKNLSGDVNAVSGSNNAHGQFYVEIKVSDYAFKTSCPLLPLSMLPDNGGEFPATVEYGMYLVGKDIQPGRYQGFPQYGAKAPCFWERQRNAGGAYDGVIANRHETQAFTVELQPDDFALFTTCRLERVND